MIAWYGEQKLKDAALERLREHRRLDQLAQRVYFESGRGCHLGCLTHRNEDAQEATERMFSIEQRVAYWLEAVFEGLPQEDCAAWVIESTEAIPVGADLSLCHHELAAWLLGPEGPQAEGVSHELVRDAVQQVRALHVRAAAGDAIADDEWSAAARSAWSARSAARSAESASAWKSIAAKSIEIFRKAPVRVATDDEQCEQCVAESMLSLSSPVSIGEQAVKGDA